MRIPADTFQRMSGLPGEEFIAPGLRGIAGGDFHSAEALLIFIARTRLMQAGFGFLGELAAPEIPDNPESRLYAILRDRDEASAYSLYNSMKRRLDSFIRGLEMRQESGAPMSET